MKKLFNAIIIAAAFVMAWGCSSSDDETTDSAAISVSEAPQWKVEFTMPKGQDGKQNWEQVDFYQFENTMTIVLHLEDEMDPFLSEGDQMAAIVNGEVREIANIQFYNVEGSKRGNIFMLLVPFADQDKFVDLYYYNAKADQTYSMNTTDLRDNNTVGSEVDFVIGLFNIGDITAKLSDNVPFTPGAGDKLALFVDDVCSGVGSYDASKQQWNIKAYKISQTSTMAHFRYYSAERSAIYKTAEVIDFNTIRRAVATPYYLDF
jgi:hypothetical protein